MEGTDCPQQLQFGAYTFVKVLGKGKDCVVALYKQTQSGKLFAVKLELRSSSTMLAEALFLKDAQGCDRIPEYVHHATIKGKKFFIMEYL